MSDQKPSQVKSIASSLDQASKRILVSVYGAKKAYEIRKAARAKAATDDQPGVPLSQRRF